MNAYQRRQEKLRVARAAKQKEYQAAYAAKRAVYRDHLMKELEDVALALSGVKLKVTYGHRGWYHVGSINLQEEGLILHTRLLQAQLHERELAMEEQNG